MGRVSSLQTRNYITPDSHCKLRAQPPGVHRVVNEGTCCSLSYLSFPCGCAHINESTQPLLRRPDSIIPGRSVGGSAGIRIAGCRARDGVGGDDHEIVGVVTAVGRTRAGLDIVELSVDAARIPVNRDVIGRWRTRNRCDPQRPICRRKTVDDQIHRVEIGQTDRIGRGRVSRAPRQSSGCSYRHTKEPDWWCTPGTCQCRNSFRSCP